MRYEYIASIVADIVAGMTINLPLVARHVIERDVPIWIAERHDSVDELGSGRIGRLEQTEGVMDDLRTLAIA